ncbi:hypothetical protein DPMN_026702 [Dreissena polymorpha]|uniref:SRCR domain-containing protein n=1 Tax=Dreissena polymorpha TaxID=45954 RepID=A0A9D4LTW9_DREPO|nr:hypothetical protein DPMN_026702 [Dreissena polymorpha]
MFPGNCEGGFTCDNGRCVARRHVCDQSDNCGDLSDEKDCGQASNVEVRLADGDEDSGRVEIKYLGEWGVICDDNWDSSDASVICQMLGYKGFSAQAVSGSRFGSGNGKFLLDEVNCTGTEKSIVDCIHTGWKVHNCRLHEVAGVSCLQKKACSSEQYTCPEGSCISASAVCDGSCNCMAGCEDERGNGEHSCETGSIDLVNGTQHSVSAGRVEITRNGLTGTICDDSWDDNDAIVVCKMKGFKFGEAVTGGYFSPGTGPIWLDDVECTGEETKLSDCRSSSWGVSNCGHAEDAGVICSNDLPPLPDLPTESPHIAPTLELVDGHDEHSGRVEMVVNNQQGTICDDQWDDNDAAVVCRMLGYKKGTAKVNGHFGSGSSKLSILLDDVDCVGTEASILDCRHSGTGCP